MRDEIALLKGEKAKPKFKSKTPRPDGSRLNGHRDFVVQGLVIKAHNVRYRLECWQTPEGKWLTGQLPDEIQGHHFDPVLRAYILYQHHHCQVTQPLLREQLQEWGIQISTGQIDVLLSTGKEIFHQEKDRLLTVGLE